MPENGAKMLMCPSNLYIKRKSFLWIAVITAERLFHSVSYSLEQLQDKNSNYPLAVNIYTPVLICIVGDALKLPS